MLNIEEKKNKILSLINYNNEDIVFLSGSLIQGIGNKYSDIDVFVITDNKVGKKGHRIEFRELDNLFLDIEYWDLETFKKIIEGINCFDENDSTIRIFDTLVIDGLPTESSLSLAHRFVVGIPINNEEEFSSLYSNIDLDNYYCMFSRMYANIVDNSYDDILGNITNKEPETAYSILIPTVFYALSAFLVSNRISIDRSKWAYIQLKNLSKTSRMAKDILKELDELIFNSPSNYSLEERNRLILELLNRIINQTNL